MNVVEVRNKKKRSSKNEMHNTLMCVVSRFHFLSRNVTQLEFTRLNNAFVGLYSANNNEYVAPHRAALYHTTPDDVTLLPHNTFGSPLSLHTTRYFASLFN